MEIFSTELKEVLKRASVEGARFGKEFLTTDFFLLGALEVDSKLKSIIEKIDPGLPYLVKSTIESEYIESSVSTLEYVELPFDKEMQRLFKFIEMEVHSGSMKTLKEVTTAEVLIVMFKDGDVMRSKTSEKLNKLGINKESVAKARKELNNTSKKEQAKPVKKDEKKSILLDNLCRPISKEAEEGTLDPVIGREKEINRIMEILSRRKKNNPVLVGDAGVGKTTIVEGLAQRIYTNDVPNSLKNKKIFELNLNDLVSGTKFRGMFEERMKAIIDELNRNDDIILFIDEIHSIVGTGNGEGGLDVGNVFKPHLAKGKIQLIGATTLTEYRKYIESDAALDRRFQKVIVDEPSREETYQILDKIRKGDNGYEAFHKVYYTPDAIKSCVDLSIRYINDRFLPDKAIDLLDETGSRIKIKRKFAPPEKLTELELKIKSNEREIEKLVEEKKFKDCQIIQAANDELKSELEKEQTKYEALLKKNKPSVTTEDVEETVAIMTGIPVSQISESEKEKLKNISTILKAKVKGQEQAIEKISKCLKRSRIDLRDSTKPIGSFIFAGESGVGKSYLAKCLANSLFNGNLIEVNMTAYMEKFEASKLLGAPPGYVGYEEGGQLTEKVRRKPYSVILLDEIEKAHPDVCNLLFQILDEGYINDSFGRRIDFRNSIIIMTSNIGVSFEKKSIGFNSKKENRKELESNINKSLEKHFPIEFLGRIDEKIIFNSLNNETVKDILELIIQESKERFKKTGIEINIDDSVKDYIIKVGYDEKSGVRGLKSVFQDYIDNIITDKLIDEELCNNDKIMVRVEEDDLKFEKMMISV